MKSRGCGVAKVVKRDLCECERDSGKQLRARHGGTDSPAARSKIDLKKNEIIKFY